MPRKRKVPVVDEEKENDGELSQNSTIHHGPMYTIMSNVQLNETFHKKYIREMQQLYAKMDHDAFMFTFIKMIKSAMEGDETNEYAYTTLLFCAKFIAAYDVDDTHPVLVDTFRWLLSTISQNPHIRFRLCQFVNQILNALGIEAALDDAICDRIMEYMVRRLRDINPNVRVQAILALQRLQIPDNPDDIVLRVYQFHLSSDPSPRVRQAVITSMGRNYNTIPYILDRLWDIDEKVRRHTYLHMSGYPVKAYKVSQRLQLLEQGLNDRSEMVKKVVTTIMLPQWLESYNKNYITFVSALKLDSSEAEVERFMKIAKVALKEIFKRQSREDLISCIPLEEDGEFHKCVPHEKLTMEVTLYWQCLIEHLQTEMADELDMIIPELSTFCAYVLRFCEAQKGTMDKFVKMEFQYVLLFLCEILYLYDLGDEIGRENLKKLITTILKSNDLSEKTIEVIVKCTENLITDQNSRLQFFVDIIEEVSSFNSDILNDRTLVAELLGKHPDESLELKLSSLKVKILGLREEEMNYVEQKDYVQAHRITEEKNACTEEYTNLVKSLLEKHSLSDQNSGDHSKSLLSCFQESKKITPETIIKCLQLAFYMVVSKNVRSLTPNVCQLYKNFIGLHIASTEIAIRDWALKCGTAYSMLYESLAKEIYEVLYAQFLKNNSIRIWKTAITCIFELLDRYGCSSFNVEERQNKTKRNGRLLYSTFLDADDDSSAGSGQAVDIIFMMSHFLDTCEDVCIISAIVNGFCRLVLHDHINSPDILEKLLLRYFNPSTDAEVNQILGVFLENLIQRKKQEYLHPCLLPTVSQVISAPYESPLHEIKPETVLRFVIDATRPEFCVPNANIHNKLALSFLQEMKNNFTNKDLCKILAKELLTLQMSVQDDVPFKENLKTVADSLITCEFDAKTLKNIIDFKDLLDGVFNPPPRRPNLDGSDDEDKSDDETVSAITTEREFDKQSSNDAAPHRLDAVAEEDKESSAENESEKGVEPSSQPNENEKESGTEEDKEAEPEPTAEPPPKTPVVSTPTQPQRSPTAPTTFGRENSTGLRYLRKSMNFTRQKSATDDGPSPKIRIEARIDSIPNVSPPKVQKMDESNARAKRRNLRGAPKSPVRAKSPVPTKSAAPAKSPVQTKSPVRAKTPARAAVDKEQATNKAGQSTRRKRKTTATKVTKGGQSKEKDLSSPEDTDDSEAIPPSPTSSATTAPASSARTFSVRANRTLRYNNNTQASKPTTPVRSKGARSTRNNTPANPPAESVRLPKSPEPVTRNTRKRPMSPNTPNKNNEETARNGSIANKLNTTTATKPQTPVTNKLRAKNSNVPEKPAQLQKSTRAALSKAGSSPSSKENEPKSPVKSTAAHSSSSSAEDSSSSSSEEEAKTPSQQKNSRFGVTKSIKRRIASSKNPVLALHRSNLSPSATRVSTRNSARKDRQNNMIMTRKRLSMENVRGSPKSSKSLAKSKASSTQLKKPHAASSLASKFSKIPVNIALRTNKSNMTADKAKPQSSKSTRSEETSEITSDSSSNSSSGDTDVPRKPTKETPKATRNTSSTTTTQRTKPVLLATRIARSTRNLNAKTMLRKRNI